MAPPTTIPAIGQSLTAFARPAGLAIWNRYAAVNDEFVPIHMDHEAGRAAGYTSAIGMGNLQWAYLHNLLREAFPETGRIASVSCKFRAPSLCDHVVTAHGIVTAVHTDGHHATVELDIWTESGGERLAVGTATVAFDAAAA